MTGFISQAELDEIGSACPNLYEAVGWDENKAPDWDAFRACCHPEAILIPMGSGVASPIPVETFITGMEGQRSSGAVRELSEIELSRSVQAFGNIASVRSTFAARIDGTERRGITFAQLVRHEGRWVIINAVWENESDDRPLPNDLI